jgi:phenylpropionate dioxygenase-like ring-hydroxylating dioxygenase large terminal subunit
MLEVTMLNLDHVLKPIEDARGLPSQLYINDELTDRERRQVFFDHWAALTNGALVPEAGSVKPIDFLGIPLLVVRSKAHEVKVFQNVCRHRGMKLIEEPGKLKGPITCPYHAWAYDLDGTLKSTPHVGGPEVHHHDTIDPAQMSLLEVPSHVWRDVVFVNVNGNAAPFESVHAEIIERWKDFDKPLFHGGEDSRFSLDLKSNWKLVVDNYCESYHLPFVHPGLNSYSRIEDHYHIVGDTGFAGQGSLVYAPPRNKSGKGFRDFDGLPEKWDKAAEYIALFPNVLLGVHRDHAYSIIIEPHGHGRVVEQIEIYYANKDATGKEFAAMRKSQTELWREVFIEDVGVVEGMYEGRFAPDYDGGKFSPIMEPPTWRFHHWIANQMSDTAKAAE